MEHKNGTETRELAPLKKSIYSLIDLREILLGCNRRYLDFLSSLDDHSDEKRALQKLTEPKTVQNITCLRRFSTGLIKSISKDSVAATIEKLARNVRQVFDYLRMTDNSRKVVLRCQTQEV